MNEKRYLVADVSCGCNIIARDMDIDTALLLKHIRRNITWNLSA